jgi:hypothetical protein
MNRSAAVELDRLFLAISEEANRALTDARPDTPESALHIWTNHVVKLLWAIQDLAARIWREFPELEPKAPLHSSLNELYLPPEVAARLVPSVVRLRSLLEEAERNYKTGMAVIERPPPALREAQKALADMDEYLQRSGRRRQQE